MFGGVSLTSPPPSGADLARTLRRAQAVARLRHPNLVRLLPLPGGAGLSPVLGDSRRLADFTLPAGTFKRFDLEQVVRLLLDVLSGLAALHEVVTDGQAFIHGQVSPQSIYIDEHGTARLVPLLNGSKPEDAGYMAPERVAGASVDARADVFSVGVMLWEALAGKRLFPKGLAQVAPGTTAPSIQLSPGTRWAQPLCALAERAIALEPAARFASALEFNHAMAAAAAQQLSRVDTDAWQEEAPTPVFQPRLHGASLRISTPPPSVLTLTPVRRLAVGGATPAAFVAPELPRQASAGRSRAPLVALALLSLSAAALLLARPPASWAPTRPTAPLAPIAVPAPAPAPAPDPSPAAAARPVREPAGVPILAGVPTLAAAPAASAATRPPASPRDVPTLVAAPAASAATRPSASPRGVPAKLAPASPKRQALPRVHTDDYGI